MSIFVKPEDTRTLEEKVADAIEASIIQQSEDIVKTYKLNATRLLNNPVPNFDPQKVLDRWGTKSQAILAAAAVIVGYVAPDELVDMPAHTKNPDGSITLASEPDGGN